MVGLDVIDDKNDPLFKKHEEEILKHMKDAIHKNLSFTPYDVKNWYNKSLESDYYKYNNFEKFIENILNVLTEKSLVDKTDDNYYRIKQKNVDEL